MKKINTKKKVNIKNIKKEFLILYQRYNFQFIAAAILIFFSFVFYLSLPSFLNYENLDKELKNKIYKDFKVSIKNTKGITYSFLPKPHFIIEESDLYLNSKNKKEIAKIKNLRIYISIVNFTKSKNIKIKNIKINNSNFNFKTKDLIDFKNHLKNNITKPIYIVSSNFFYLDNKNEVISIFPIKNFKYYIDQKNKDKILKISGKLFDTDCNFKWVKNYSKPNIVETFLNLKNPNVKIENILDKKHDSKIYTGNTNFNFLNNKFTLNYFFDEDKINFNSNNNSSDKVKMRGKVDLKPFYFNASINLLDFDINSVTQKLFSYLYSLKNMTHPYLNGNLFLNLSASDNKLFDYLKLNFSLLEGKVNINKSNFFLKRIGEINFSEVQYIARQNKL